MKQAYAREREIALAAVRAAAGVTRSVQAALVSDDTLQKKDKSPVTVADFASQAIVCAMLGEAVPDIPLVGEENADALRQEVNAGLRDAVVRHVAAVRQGANSDEVLACIDRGGFDPAAGGAAAARYWTLDPIDGTKGFLRGEQYAIALALIEDGQVVLGMLGCPNLNGGVLMAAVREQGTQMLSLQGSDQDGKAVRVSEVADAANARFCESVESSHSDQSQSARIARALGIEADPVRMDSQAKYAAVAGGDASIYLRLPTRREYRERIWDHAAGMLVVEEAGGRVTDIHGRPLDFSRGRSLENNEGIIATNGRIHDAVLQAVADAM